MILSHARRQGSVLCLGKNDAGYNDIKNEIPGISIDVCAMSKDEMPVVYIYPTRSPHESLPIPTLVV